MSMDNKVHHVHPATLNYRRAKGNPLLFGWEHDGAAWHSWCLADFFAAQGVPESTRELRGLHEAWITTGSSRLGYVRAEQERMGRIWISLYDSGFSPLPRRIADSPDDLSAGPSHCRVSECCRGECTGHGLTEGDPCFRFLMA